MPPLEVTATCGIAQRVEISRVGRASMMPVETDCRVALRLALWERHDLQRLSAEFFGIDVARMKHFSSFSCRRMRTSRGESQRWSTHARGEAIDVSGFVLNDGTEIDLRIDWSGLSDEAGFLRSAQRSSCKWFGGVLGPDFNNLHADHFHMQVSGRGFCR
ncbi:MAG: extensin family protein [Boseongicola sp.]|nr:extensin family protein [Boseongicola sp.]NNL17579.1 extensin family protein [Boseongicola sp.]